MCLMFIYILHTLILNTHFIDYNIRLFGIIKEEPCKYTITKPEYGQLRDTGNI